MCVTAASGGCLLFAQYWPFAILKPKNRTNRKTDTCESSCRAPRGRSAIPRIRHAEQGPQYPHRRGGCVRVAGIPHQALAAGQDTGDGEDAFALGLFDTTNMGSIGMIDIEMTFRALNQAATAMGPCRSARCQSSWRWRQSAHRYSAFLKFSAIIGTVSSAPPKGAWVLVG
jgi:hypothetical protein